MEALLDADGVVLEGARIPHDLIEEASHGEEGRYPGDDAFPDEEETDAAYGEADEEEQPDL